MSDAEIKSLAEEYKQLEKSIAKEESKPYGSMADIRSYEDRMARIETKFQKADLDIMQWL